VGWGILGISLLGLFIGFVIVQEMFSQRHWRSLVNHGDRWAIRTLIEQEIERWRGMRVPKGTDASLWHGIQTAEIAGVGRDFVHLICSAEGEYRVIDGRRQEISSPLDEGMKLAAAVLERVFYDIPNVRLALIRVDVYTTFRGDDGTPEQRCILSSVAERIDADRLPWDDLRANEIFNRFDSSYRLSDNGVALPIDPAPALTEEEPEPTGPEQYDGAGTQALPPPAESFGRSRDAHP
jgi:hypothetical protein